MKGLRLDVPFEVLKKTDLSEGLLTLASGLCGAMTFQELRKVGGTLPGKKWLEKRGHYGLVVAKQRHPELFAEVRP